MKEVMLLGAVIGTCDSVVFHSVFVVTFQHFASNNPTQILSGNLTINFQTGKIAVDDGEEIIWKSDLHVAFVED